MATFAKQTFNTSTYASFRPTYPRQLFDYIFKFHEQGPASGSASRSRWDLAVDLGCGTGQATIELSPFKRVIGVDPSQKMIEGARAHVESLGLQSSNRFEFVQGPAEDLGFLQDGSVDLLVAAQAAHWFDWQRAWTEHARVLRPGGTSAFWCYSEFRLSQFPSLTPLITEYSQGTDPATSLGPHWQRPGRTILDDHLVDVPEPEKVVGPGVFGQLQRVYFTAPWEGSHYPELPKPHLPVILRKKMSWSDLLAYLRTWSSLHTFQERYPEDSDTEGGDIAVRFRRKLMEHVAAAEDTPVQEDATLDIEWPLAMILVKKAL
ncbi:hypothetical protein HGRIS_014360 [Hohenbuehelia grisea]|uniref:Methyltransferase type 11 domain-containing protein n=1 Tax=Hohenbuehelia grisea TaxID=104357 RepID=A0ABR3JT61_9AGAR